MEAVVVVALIVAFVGYIAFILWKLRGEAVNSMKEAFEQAGVKPDLFMTTGISSAVALDTTASKLGFLRSVEGRHSVSSFGHRDLISVDLIEDGNSLSHTSNSSIAGRAILGAIAFGGVGAIVGGVTAKAKVTSTISSISLQVVVNDAKDPVKVIHFLDQEVEKKSFSYECAIEDARQWHATISVFIRQAEKESSGAKTERQPSPSITSIADELSKLAELKGSGILTEDEFQEQKRRLLSMNSA